MARRAWQTTELSGKYSADIPAELRKILEGVEVGRLTAPEVTKMGVEMFAMCAKKDSSAENTPGRRQERGQAARYLVRAA